MVAHHTLVSRARWDHAAQENIKALCISCDVSQSRFKVTHASKSTDIYVYQ